MIDDGHVIYSMQRYVMVLLVADVLFFQVRVMILVIIIALICLIYLVPTVIL